MHQNSDRRETSRKVDAFASGDARHVDVTRSVEHFEPDSKRNAAVQHNQGPDDSPAVTDQLDQPQVERN